jgi:hypothetical protein
MELDELDKKDLEDVESTKTTWRNAHSIHMGGDTRNEERMELLEEIKEKRGEFGQRIASDY